MQQPYVVQFNPVALHLGPVQVHWYGLMYLLSFIGAWACGEYRRRRARRDTLPGNLLRGLAMQNDNLDRADLCRLADDGCPHAGDTKSHDLAELWDGAGKDDRPTR